VKVCVLGSGSSGNATLVTSNGTAVLIDAGLSCRQIALRMESVGADPADLDAVFVTHEHGDHIGGLATLVKRFGPNVHATEATVEAAGAAIPNPEKVRIIEAGTSCEFGSLDFHPFSLSHDTIDTVGYVVSDGTVSVGIATDLGFASAIARHRLRGCDLVIIEANHDPAMLQACRYPWHIKRRIASRHGHLSNADAAMLVAEIVPDGTHCVVLAHISEDNNEPELAVRVVKDELAARGLDGVQILTASRSKPTPVMEVRTDWVTLSESLR
jgi:phosphoribosyl 1,2-cyclic phosphodiesterase